MNKEYTKNLTLPWANICKVILFKIKLTGEILLELVEIIILCRLLHRSVLNIDRLCGVDILDILDRLCGVGLHDGHFARILHEAV